MAKTPRLMPEHPRMFRAEVLHTRRISPSIQRVTVKGEDLHEFPWQGYDHWLRLFLRLPHQQRLRLRLPEFTGSRWWQPYLAIPEEERPHCANCTLADFRPEAAELDIDFVVHLSPAGELEGGAASWACAARPGDALALLDQGVLFDCPSDASQVLVVADEAGLPATTGILRSLPRETVGRVIQEVPTADDIRTLDAPDGVSVTWVVRDDPATVPGTGALRELLRHHRVEESGHGFVVGESALATQGRRHRHRAGLPKDRIFFSGFWRHETRQAA
ncbi:siderophore-interacting protein [Streptomyces canus]|uniref:siderophore-interacting protein n=1 Tax=Streptomyces canus TaxID=58343 RepID=UPI0033FCBB29